MTELADCKSYCADGVLEAKACCDTEAHAHFLLQEAHFNIIEGLDLVKTISMINVCALCYIVIAYACLKIYIYEAIYIYIHIYIYI